jgi:hypothetical protein
MQRKKLVLIIVGLAAALLALNFLGVIRLLDTTASGAPADYDENTKTIQTWQGGNSGFVMVGYWDDPSQESPQLLDSPSYVTSWKTAGSSEAIIPTATVFNFILHLKEPHWEYYVATAGGDGWKLVKSTPATVGDVIGGVLQFSPPNPLYYLSGEINGWLRVQFVTELWTPGYNLLDGDVVNDYRGGGAWVRDDAALISARGTITSPTELSVWEIGQTITITADLGSACSKKAGATANNATSGYTLELFSAAQGQTMKTWDMPCGPGTFSIDAAGARTEYTVTEDDFSTAGGCRNTLEIRLFNDLFLKDRTDVKTIDLVSNKPDPPTMEVSVEGGVWEEGKTVHIKVNTPVTTALVSITVEYQESGVQVLRRDRVAQFEFDIVPNVAGILTVAASIETDCHASDPVEYTLVIKDKEPPNFYDNNPAASYLWLILIIVGILMILVGIFLGGFWEILIRVIIILIGVVFIIVGFLLLGG